MARVGQTRRVNARVGLGYGLGLQQTNPSQTRTRGAGLRGLLWPITNVEIENYTTTTDPSIQSLSKPPHVK